MSAEIKPSKSPTLPVEKEKLDHLWQTAWEYLEKNSDNATNERQLILIGSMLVEIKSYWDSDMLDGITIRSWNTIHGPTNPFTELVKEADLQVKHPGSLGTRDGYYKQKFEFEGKVSTNWVETIQGCLDFFLKH